MEMEDRRSHPCMHLPSRLDHLDFIMKYMEGKRSLQRGPGKEYVPVDLAMKEACFKGSVLDRVAAMERRLSQLCLELESSGTSCTFTSTSGYASCSQGSKAEPVPSSSLPTLCHSNLENKQVSQPLFRRSEIQGKTHTDQQKRENLQPVSVKPQNGKKRSSMDGKACKSTGKKRVSPKWPHLRFFGC
ncbi:hypothetical protein SLA2020_092260 [Shorea laevis]